MKDKNEERAWEMFRKSIGPRIWSGRDLIEFFCFGIVFGILLTLPLVALADNEITIEQTGDNLNLEVEQVGVNNVIQMQDVYSYISASSLDLLLIQYNDTSTSNQIVIDEMRW